VTARPCVTWAAVFPVYGLHQTVIVVLAHRLQPQGVLPALEAPLLMLATFAGCFAGDELIRRVAWLRPLFGLKAVSGRPERRPLLAGR
jgi:glucan biosynthesis protein C